MTTPLMVCFWGGGIKRWLKKEIPLEDRKKLFNAIWRWTSNESLSKEYIFIRRAGAAIVYERSNSVQYAADPSRALFDVIPADTIDHILE